MELFAHRGYSSHYPENTLLAFKKALHADFDGIELDVRLSKDGVPVVIHDATIHRTSNGGKQFVHNLTLAQLKQYDFGSWLDQDFTGEKIPTLEEVLQLLQHENVTLNIELKNGPIIPKQLERKVLDLVYQYNMEDKVLYSSFDHQSLYRLYQLDQTIKAGFIFHINLINPLQYIDQLNMQAYSIHPNYFYVTEDMIKEAHKRDMKINVYTVDDMDWAKRLQKLGINGLITNKIIKDNFK